MENFALTLAFFKQLTADKEAKVFTVRIKIKKGRVSIWSLKRKKKGGENPKQPFGGGNSCDEKLFDTYRNFGSNVLNS